MANGNTYYLQSTTNLEDLFESFDANEDLAPIIECAGFDLVLNEGCDAADPDGKIYNITIRNSGSENKFILEDKSRIRLGTPLPTNVCPWVNPNKPLPYCDPVTGSYETKNTANARCEIQLNGNFGLGGGPANLPTETKPGPLFVKVDRWIDNKTAILQEDANLCPNDIILNPSFYKFTKSTVLSYNNKTVYLDNAQLRYSNTNILVCCNVAILIKPLVKSAITYITSPMIVGSLALMSPDSEVNNSAAWTFTNNYVIGNRIIANVTNTSDGGTGKLSNGGFVKANQLYAPQFGSRSDYNSNIIEIEANEYFGFIDTSDLNPTQLAAKTNIIIKNGYIYIRQFPIACYDGKIHLINCNIDAQPTISYDKSFIHLINCTIAGNKFYNDTILLKAGTIDKILRSNFESVEIPDTDIPDAFLHRPSSGTTITWRYEDYYVRKNETLAINVKWLPSHLDSKVCIAITPIEIWWPSIWKLNQEPYAKTEFESGLNVLTWHSKQFSWINNTGEDKQVRLWECVTGNKNGGYLRTWRSSGGVL